MPRAEQIVSILLEETSGMLVFGPNYPLEGAWVADPEQWAKQIVPLRRGNPFLSRKQRKDTDRPVDQAIAEMLSRGYSFVVKDGDGVTVITSPNRPQITTDKHGIKNIEDNFGIKYESTVGRKDGLAGNKQTVFLPDIVAVRNAPPASQRAEPKEPKVKPKAPIQRQPASSPPPTPAQAVAPDTGEPEGAPAHPVGAQAPDPNEIQPYPIEVYIGMTTVNTPQGVMVSDVKEDSPAAQAGFERNDVIRWIGEYFPKKDRYNQDPDRVMGPHYIGNNKEWQATAGQFVEGDVYEITVSRGDGETRLALIPEPMKKMGRQGPEMFIPGSEIK